MKELVIENPTRIVNLHNDKDYVPGLYARVETPKGNYVATWEHRPEAGCVILSPIKDGEELYEDMGLCRNAVLIASLCHFQRQMAGEDWPAGCDIPLLAEEVAKGYLDGAGIPDDQWGTFNTLLKD